MQFQLPQFLSQKFRFWSFVSMLFLVVVHAYNLDNRYLEPFTTVDEPLRFTTFIEYFFANGILRFRIPMLFAISGYLFALGDTKPHSERIKSRVQSLVIPYLLWSFIGIGLTFFLERFTQTQGFVRAADLSKPIVEYGVEDYLTRGFLFPIPFQLWFIRVLFVYNLAYLLIRRVVERSPKIWFYTLIPIWLILPIHLGFIEPEGLLFFSLGVWLQKRNFNLETIPHFGKMRLSVPIAAGAWIFLTIAKTLIAFAGIHDQFAFLAITMLHRICEGLGLYVAWFGMDALVRWCMEHRWFRWSSSFSFIIYALHVPLVNYLLFPAFQVSSNIPMFRLMLFIALPSIIILFCIGVGAFLRRVAPPVYSVLTGGRGL